MRGLLGSLSGLAIIVRCEWRRSWGLRWKLKNLMLGAGFSRAFHGGKALGNVLNDQCQAAVWRGLQILTPGNASETHATGIIG